MFLKRTKMQKFHALLQHKISAAALRVTASQASTTAMTTASAHALMSSSTARHVQ